MRKITKRLVALLLAVAMAIPTLPASVKEVKAAGETITLNFVRPTTGVISNRAADQVEGAYVLLGIDGNKTPDGQTRTYTITTALRGDNWSINSARTIPQAVAGHTDALNFPKYNESAGTTRHVMVIQNLSEHRNSIAQQVQ